MVRIGLCESDGRLCHSWLPGIEDDDWLPLDRGGYDEQHDAFGFKLAIDLVRAEAGLIDVAPESIEAERLSSTRIKTGRPTKEPQAALDRLADRIRGKAPSLDDFAGRATPTRGRRELPGAAPSGERARGRASAHSVGLALSSPPTTRWQSRAVTAQSDRVERVENLGDRFSDRWGRTFSRERF